MDAGKKPGQPDSGMRQGTIPRGVEVLLKKASMDSEFRKLLMEQRGDAARAIDLELTEAKRELLVHIPAQQLAQIIDNTKVNPVDRAAFMGTVGALMVAGISCVT